MSRDAPRKQRLLPCSVHGGRRDDGDDDEGGKKDGSDCPFAVAIRGSRRTQAAGHDRGRGTDLSPFAVRNAAMIPATGMLGDFVSGRRRHGPRCHMAVGALPFPVARRQRVRPARRPAGHEMPARAARRGYSNSTARMLLMGDGFVACLLTRAAGILVHD